MRICSRCRRHVLHKTCPFCASRRAVIAGTLTAASLVGAGACGGKSTIGVPEYLGAPAEAGPDAPDSSFVFDSGFIIPDASIPDTAGKDTSIAPVYGAPPLPDE